MLRAPQVIACFGFLGGVFLISFFVPPFTARPAAPAAFVFLFATFLFSVCFAARRRARFLFVVVLCSFLLGIARYAAALPIDAAGRAEQLALSGQRMFVTGAVVKEPERFQRYARYVVAIDAVAFAHGNTVFRERAQGRVLVYAQNYPEFLYGDSVEMRGTLQQAKHDSVVSYRAYLAKDGIAAVMYYPEMTLIESGGGNRWWAAIIRIKAHFAEIISRRFPEPEASYLLGLLIGVRRGLPEDIIEAFRLTGMTHVLALSGFNITIVAAAIMFVLAGVQMRWRLIIACFAIAAFVMFVGASSSVARAGVMGILGLIALGIGRPQAAWYPLLLAAAAIVLWNPFTLVFDIGFQLSFAATLGLIFLRKPFAEGLLRLSIFKRAPRFFCETASVTLAAQVATLPLLLIYFRQFSIVSPLANLIVLPFIPITMLFGFVAVILDVFHFGLGLIPGAVAYMCLHFMLGAIELFAKIPFAAFG